MTLTALTNSDRSTDTKGNLFFRGFSKHIGLVGFRKNVPTGVNQLSSKNKKLRGGIIFFVAKYRSLCVNWFQGCQKLMVRGKSANFSNASIQGVSFFKWLSLLIRELTHKCPIGDNMHNWAFQIGDWGLEIEDWRLGIGEQAGIGWNRLEQAGKAGIDWYRMEYAGIGLYQPFPANSRLFSLIPAYSNLFQPIPLHSSIPVCSNLVQHIPAYSSLFQPIPSQSSLFQPIQSFSKDIPIPNLHCPIPNLQFEMPNCAFYPQLEILSVSSLLTERVCSSKFGP